jgi:hypothetical protein
MMLILNEERVKYSKRKSLDLELLLNRISSIFKPIEEEAPEDESLQVALTAQIHKSEYKGIQAKNLSCQKPIQNSRPERVERESDSKLTRLILDLKAEIGILRKAMVNHSISLKSAPTSNTSKQREQSAVVKQNGKFAGIAKKKSGSRRTNLNSLVEPLNELTDSHNEPQEQAYSMIMIKPKLKKNYSPRSMNKMLVGYTRHNHKDAACNSERAAAEEPVSSSQEVEARMSVDWSLQEDLFGNHQA